jgi:hypothetical protein
VGGYSGRSLNNLIGPGGRRAWLNPSLDKTGSILPFFPLNQYKTALRYSPKMVDHYSYILGYENAAVCMMMGLRHP